MRYHKGLTRERWSKFSIDEQMANVGSEVFRAMKFRREGNEEYATLAYLRALELFDLTLAVQKRRPDYKEVSRARELWVDYFLGGNKSKRNEETWQKYFLAYNYAARADK